MLKTSVTVKNRACRSHAPLSNADPDTTLSADERQIGGPGVFAVKSTMDDVSYEYKGGKNILTVVKKISRKGESLFRKNGR